MRQHYQSSGKWSTRLPSSSSSILRECGRNVRTMKIDVSNSWKMVAASVRRKQKGKRIQHQLVSLMYVDLLVERIFSHKSYLVITQPKISERRKYSLP
jgi:hypothetical protein